MESEIIMMENDQGELIRAKMYHVGITVHVVKELTDGMLAYHTGVKTYYKIHKDFDDMCRVLDKMFLSKNGNDESRKDVLYNVIKNIVAEQGGNKSLTQLWDEWSTNK